MTDGRTETRQQTQAWRALRFFNYYRITLSIFLTILGASPYPTQTIGSDNPLLFLLVSSGYLLFSFASAFTLYRQRPTITSQVQLQSLGDVVALTLLIHASGGLSSGLGILLAVAVAGDALLMEGRLAYLLAASATLAVLTEQSIRELMGFVKGSSYTEAGLLGTGLFATAVLARLLAQRVLESEALAHRRGIDLADLTELNAHIIQQMDAGVMVVTASGHVRLLNTAAWNLLGMPVHTTQRNLYYLCPELAQQVKRWHTDPGMEPVVFRPIPEGNEVLPRFSALIQTAGTELLITLEDASALAEQAQQMKLAALGRLTASIAHEIRNPLGAVSHAAQLLEEAHELEDANRRLTRIICDQTRRLNSIIENVLFLSRRELACLENIPLAPLLEETVASLRSSPGFASSTIITVSIVPQGLTVRFDMLQIRQVLDNLCHNALRHAHRNDTTLHLRLEAATTPEGAWLDVSDNGPGVPREAVHQIFEPFFTTRRDGTGLGLYLARELCEANLARLTYLTLPDGGSRFRIRFARNLGKGITLASET